METPLAGGLLMAALAGAAIALLTGMAASVVIWRRGAKGAWSTAAGVAVSLAIFAWPAAVAPFYLRMPHLNDVTTDTEHPPEFSAVDRNRAKAANPVAYRPAYAERQAQIFPQIQPMIIDRPADEVFDAAGEAARRLKWRIVAEEAPETGKRPAISGEDRTLILGSSTTSLSASTAKRQTRVDVRSLAL